MKSLKMLFMIPVVLLFFSAVATAGDFDWMRDFNIRAEADPSGFRARLVTRFNIGDAQIKTVLSNIEKPSDAYMACRFGEMSGKPADYVMEKYKSKKNKGWGVLAKSLGIKTGSKEFHSLKLGNDFYADNDKKKKKRKNKGETNSKKKGKNKG
ncbi:hypothetical protein [Desulfobacula sp.]|uniref:hypothetical protein n=1 Tax=Desulfobacula sp. TaxID=2593537 RepID=UPI002608D37E|nr:hypothetical protein [Desulfobacula sp.]